MRKANVIKERQRYSIRKYSFGATSVLIGASLMLWLRNKPIAQVQVRIMKFM